jgi:DNA-binding GntR family transcriptional regulator
MKETKFDYRSKSKDEFVTHRDLLEALKERDLMNFQRLMQKHLEIYSDFIDS